MYYVLDGLFREQKFEILAFVLATIFICLYAIVDFVYDALMTNSATISESGTLVNIYNMCMFVFVDKRYLHECNTLSCTVNLL